MRLGTRVIAGIFLLLGAFMVSQAPGYRLMTPDAGAGPGLLPLLTGLGLIAAAISIILISSADEPIELPPDTIPDRAGTLRVFGIALAFFAVIVLIVPLGYRVTMFLFLMGTMWLLGRRDLPLMIGVAIFGSLGVYWLFTERLMVILPQGAVGF